MSKSLRAVVTAGVVMLLGACGGGGSSDIATATSTGTGSGSTGTSQLRPTVFTSEGRMLNSCSLSPGCSGNPYAPFFAVESMAPANGAALSGVVRIEVRGNDMQNVELLPAEGYLPRLGVFNITGDRTLAWLDLDTTRLANGPLGVRVSAFNMPAGQAGATEIIAVPARTWNINNTTPPSTQFSASVTSAPGNGAAVSGINRLELRGSGIANAELLPASGYAPTLGVFNVSADRTLAWLDFDSRSLPDGMWDLRVSAFNVMPGQAGASEIVAMPTRRWDVRNGSTSAFTATVTMAPLNGEVVSGRTRLEVRGSGMKNVELLPASGYTPQLGVFSVDANGTFAWLEFDTASLPNGVLNARISAFNVLPGQAGAREIIAMPARQWEIRH